MAIFTRTGSTSSSSSSSPSLSSSLSRLEATIQSPLLISFDDDSDVKKTLSSSYSTITTTDDTTSDTETTTATTIASDEITRDDSSAAGHAQQQQQRRFHDNDGTSLKIDLDVPDGTFFPINSDLFEGRLCLLLKDNPESKYDFDGDEDVFWELQVQGKFKRQPKGPIYFSLELPQEEEFKASWALKAAINAVLSFIRSFGYKWLHSSWGGKGDRPHMASPLFQALDKVTITSSPNNDSPPLLGKPINEPDERSHQRKKFVFDHIIDTSSTYTFSFNQTYFDPVGWCIRGVPLFKTIDVSKMTNVLRVSFYEVEESVEDDGYVVNWKENGNSTTWGDVRAFTRGRHTKRNDILWIQLERM